MYFFARLWIDLQISIFGFSHKLLVFRIYHREYVKSARYTPLRRLLNTNTTVTTTTKNCKNSWFKWYFWEKFKIDKIFIFVFSQNILQEVRLPKYQYAFFIQNATIKNLTWFFLIKIPWKTPKKLICFLPNLFGNLY